jgi:hypothetical protein
MIIKRVCRPLKACDFRGLQIVCFQASSCLIKDPEKAFKASLYFPASAVLHVSCSFLSLSLSKQLCSLVCGQCLHTLAPDIAATSTLAFLEFSFKMMRL